MQLNNKYPFYQTPFKTFNHPSPLSFLLRQIKSKETIMKEEQQNKKRPLLNKVTNKKISKFINCIGRKKKGGQRIQTQRKEMKRQRQIEKGKRREGWGEKWEEDLLNVISSNAVGIVSCHHGLHLHQVLLHSSLFKTSHPSFFFSLCLCTLLSK